MNKNIFKSILLISTTVFALLISSCDIASISNSESNSDSSLDSSSSTTSPSTSIYNGPVYQIMFFTDGAMSDIDPIKAHAGDPISSPSDPIKTGYSFKGWFLDYNTFLEQFVFDVMPSRNIVLYAKWQEISNNELQAYENGLLENSKANHLYIHYRRFAHEATDYSKWDIWVWPHYPDDGAGRIVNFEKKDTTTYFDDFGGATIDLDLTKVYTDGGNKYNETVSYLDKNGNVEEQIGFLIVYSSSRANLGANNMWVSDGGNQYFKSSDAKWSNGSYHVFTIQDNVSKFTYRVSSEEVSNPYDNDDGKNTSSKYEATNPVSWTNKAIAQTSGDFYSNVGVGYQIMVASFADSDGDGMGDIRGIYNKVKEGYFTDKLHVNCLWLTPIQLSDSYHGYDIIDYTAVDPKFGSRTSPWVTGDDSISSPNETTAMADYLDLLALCKQKNIRVAMDLVINHTSINNVWFQKSIALDKDYRAYYHWRNHKTDSMFTNGEAKNWYPYSTYDYSYYGKFSPSMPELDYSYQPTRDAIVDVAKFWAEKGVSAFRIDAVKHIYMKDEADYTNNTVISDYDSVSKTDYSSNLSKNLNFFRELNANLKQSFPDAFIVGENFDGHAYQVAPYYEGLDSMLNFYNYYNMSSASADARNTTTSSWNKAALYSGGNDGAGSFSATTGDIKYGNKWNYPGTLSTYSKYRGDGNDSKIGYKAIDSTFTSNHDVARLTNRVMGNVDTSSGDISSQGTITSTNASIATKSAMCVAIADIMLPGITWIYYGDELAMSGNFPDGESATTGHSDRWYRQPMKWNKNGTVNDGNGTCKFSYSGDKTYVIEWDSYNKTLDGVNEQWQVADSPLKTMSNATSLKSSAQALIKGSYTPKNVGGNIFAFERSFNGNTYRIYVNFGNSATSINETGTVAFSYNGASSSSLPSNSALVIKA